MNAHQILHMGGAELIKRSSYPFAMNMITQWIAITSREITNGDLTD